MAAESGEKSSVSRVFGVLGLLTAGLGFMATNEGQRIIHAVAGTRSPPRATETLREGDGVPQPSRPAVRRSSPAASANSPAAGANRSAPTTVNEWSGSGNVQVQGDGNVINQAPPTSRHPVTSSQGLKWTENDFYSSVRDGNLEAVREYLDGGFDPNAQVYSSFMLEGPIVSRSSAFPAVVTMFRGTGKLDFKAVAENDSRAQLYQHPLTQEWVLFRAAGTFHRPQDAKALLDAGADPKQLIADDVATLQRLPHDAVGYRGAITGKLETLSQSYAENDLDTLKKAGYPIPAL